MSLEKRTSSRALPQKIVPALLGGYFGGLWPSGHPPLKMCDDFGQSLRRRVAGVDLPGLWPGCLKEQVHDLGQTCAIHLPQACEFRPVHHDSITKQCVEPDGERAITGKP